MMTETELIDALVARWGTFSLDYYTGGPGGLWRWICSNRDAYSRTHVPSLIAVGATVREALQNAYDCRFEPDED